MGVVLGLTLLVSGTGPPAAKASTPQMHDVIVTLRAQTDLQVLSRAGTQRARRNRVIDSLKTTAAVAQRPLLGALRGLRRDGQVGRVRPFWVSNIVAVQATDAAVAAIRLRPEVLSVTAESTFSAPDAQATTAAAEPNLVQVRATEMWAQGLTGQGVVVAVLDTGADVGHPDLAGSWRGGSNSWFDPYGQHTAEPVDVNGHGTWAAGVVVGGGAGGTSIGMAPAARWIAARVFDDQSRGTSSAIHAALQWAIDPDHDPATDDAADVINNSWAFGAPGCNLEFQQDLVALRTLDILPVFAAGNGGPGAGTSYSPANYPEAFSVGSVDAGDAVLADSSRGPSSCGGRARAFPDLVAPGKNVRTSDLFGLWTTASGTSMAAPHVAGALALLLSGRRGLPAAAQETALRDGALDLGAGGPDDVYGSGRLDAASAWELVRPPADTVGPATSGVLVSPDPTNLATPPVVQATADDSASGGSTITAAEVFVDQPGADGTGVPLTLTTAGATRTEVTGPLGAGYADGVHSVYVHAQDAAGQWGQLSTGTFVVDRSAPTLAGLAATPNPTGGATALTVTASAADSGGVAAAEVVELGTRVPAFNGTMTAADGAFGGVSEQVRVGLATTGWRAGQHLLQARTRDRAGNWSAFSAVTVVVGPADALFADGFETGSTARWSQTYGGSRLTVTSSGSPVGKAALQVSVSGSLPSYVQDNTPAAEGGYRARFWFDPRGTRTASSGHDVLVGLNATKSVVFRVRYRRTTAGQLQLRAGASNGSGQSWTAWTTISAGPHAVELAWTAGSPGGISLFVDGAARGSAGGLSNGTVRLETVRLGPSGGLDAATTGTETFDAFASSRRTALGP